MSGAPSASSTILGAALQNLLPLAIVAIRAHFNATGAMPTDEQVIAALALDTTAEIAKADAYLQLKAAALSVPVPLPASPTEA